MSRVNGKYSIIVELYLIYNLWETLIYFNKLVFLVNPSVGINCVNDHFKRPGYQTDNRGAVQFWISAIYWFIRSQL